MKITNLILASLFFFALACNSKTTNVKHGHGHDATEQGHSHSHGDNADHLHDDEGNHEQEEFSFEGEKKMKEFTMIITPESTLMKMTLHMPIINN